MNYDGRVPGDVYVRYVMCHTTCESGVTGNLCFLVEWWRSGRGSMVVSSSSREWYGVQTWCTGYLYELV